MTNRALLVLMMTVILIGALEDRSQSVSKYVLGQKLVGPSPEHELEDISSTEQAYGMLDTLLETVVSEEGLVDYDKLLGSEQLIVLVRWFGRHGPQSQPALFPTYEDSLAYYINAYNTLVLWGAIQHWPIKSVLEVSANGLVSFKPQQGFFISLRFVLDKTWRNLYELENDIIRSFEDARIHAAINCASMSCPKLAQQAYRPEDIDLVLNKAMEEMVRSPKHLEVVEADGIILASSIFQWFREDFEAEAPSLIEFWAAYATEPQAAALRAAETEGYRLQFTRYDWRINSQ